jgi:hydrogenase nickel incorporation protein HypA/HybF
MHEFSIARGLLSQCERIALENGATRMVAVTLRIGAMSGIETELLRSAFDALKSGTFAEGSLMNIEPVAIHISCEKCGAESKTNMFPSKCPRCGSDSTRPEGGMELTLVSLDLV